MIEMCFLYTSAILTYFFQSEVVLVIIFFGIYLENQSWDFDQIWYTNTLYDKDVSSPYNAQHDLLISE